MWISWSLRFCIHYQIRLKQTVILSSLLGIAVAVVYLMLFTPTPVYLLDRLNMRQFFLPNILCNRCTNLTFNYLINNRSACDTEQVRVTRALTHTGSNIEGQKRIFGDGE